MTEVKKGDPDRVSNINAAVRRLNEKYSSGGKFIVRMASEIGKRDRIKSGIYSLDRALDGGFPYGHYTVIAGGIGSGKSTLCYRIVAEGQKQHDARATYIDAEGRFSPEWAIVQGVDLDRLVVVNPVKATTAEDILQFALDRTDDDSADIIVLDSVSALTPKREKEADMEKESMALAPALLSKFFRKSVGSVSSANDGRGVCFIFVTQYRETLDMYATGLKKIPGGNALKSYAHYILACSSRTPKDSHNITRDDGFILNIDLAKVSGNTKGSLELEFRHGTGIDPTMDIINSAIATNVIEKQGGGYYEIKGMDSPVRVRGIKTFVDEIINNPSYLEHIINMLDRGPLINEVEMDDDDLSDSVIEEL